MDLGLKGKVALITGSSRGIGRAIALSLAENGAKVVINYAGNETAAIEAKDMIEAVGGEVLCLKQFDVSDSDAVDAAISSIKKEYGQLDILVNNAGISKDMLILRFKNEDWDRTLATNLSGAFYCSRAAAKIMLRQRSGRIINISSVVGESGNAGQVAYSSAKAGLIGMTKTLSQELASRNVTVNAVTPGFIETDMTAELNDDQKANIIEHIPLKRMGRAKEIADSVTFLASDNAAYITGQILGINGGMYM